MLERLVAGLVVIGALLWVASTLATPDSPPEIDGATPLGTADTSDPELSPNVPVDPPAAGEGGESDGDEDEPDEEAPPRKGKGKRDGGDADA